MDWQQTPPSGDSTKLHEAMFSQIDVFMVSPTQMYPILNFCLTRLSSLDFDEGVLLEDAMDAGLIGGSFFKSRALSRPFSLGECAGLPLGEEGSCNT